MNQILVINDNTFCSSKNFRNNKLYFYLFFISIITTILLLLYFFFNYCSLLAATHTTHLLKSKYNIGTLYPSSTNYTTLKLTNNISIIGLIEIPKINISYPIIENTTTDLLKISVCKLYGPSPNRIGNLCIAGHNYKNNSMFSKLHKLSIGDSFYITDLNDIKLKYIIYKKFVVNENNLECIKETDSIEVTLITCNNIDNSKRLIIKAKMEGWYHQPSIYLFYKKLNFFICTYFFICKYSWTSTY